MARQSTEFTRPSRVWANAPVHVTGIALVAVAAGLVVASVVEAAYGDPDVAGLAGSALFVAAVGAIMWRSTRVPEDMHRRTAFVAATSVWVGISVAGAVPYRITGLVPTVELAFFESVSGFTATGATVVSPIEGHGHGVLLFRQMTQWFGSMGMVVLAVAVLTFLGVGGMQLLKAEAPGPEVERLAPRVSETARRLWVVYVALTALGAGALILVGMGPYDAVAHAMTGIATGGFSPHDASISYFDSVAVEAVVIVIMFAGAVNFALMWRVAHRRTMIPLLRSSEFRVFLGGAVAATAFVSAVLVLVDGMTIGSALRGAGFTVVSLMSTTGFGTDDYVQWAPAAQLVLLMLMVTGGMAGSTSGAVKLFRVQVTIKHAVREIRRVAHPRAVLPVRLGQLPVAERIVTGILAFVMWYFVLAVVGTVALTFLGTDLETAIGSIATAMGGVGPGLNQTGPASNFLVMDGSERLVMDLYMLFGRLEILPMLVAGGALLQRLPTPSARALVRSRELR